MLEVTLGRRIYSKKYVYFIKTSKEFLRKPTGMPQQQFFSCLDLDAYGTKKSTKYLGKHSLRVQAEQIIAEK
jgi:hypothetical protein